MLPDFGWSELLVIAIVLIVVVGPKDLPKMLRAFGKTTASLRKMAGDFRKQLDEALKEADLEDVRKIASDMKGLDPRNQIREALNPLGKIGQDISSELKKATQDVETPAKPKTAAETALESAGDKMREAQQKAKPAEPVGDVGESAKPTGKTAAKSASKPGAKMAAAVPAKPAAAKPAAAKPAAAKAVAPKAAAAKPAATKPAPAKATTTAKAKPAPTAAKPKARTKSGEEKA